MSVSIPYTSHSIAVLDIGSNAVRIGAWQIEGQNARAIHNEKELCQIGRGIGATGHLSEEGVTHALRVLHRYIGVAGEYECDPIIAVGTAALREACDGQDFIDTVARKFGVNIRLLSGEEEAHLAALGVLRQMGDAQGIVADLGGGSLELAAVEDGTVGETVSLPLGSLKLMPQRDKLDTYIDSHLNILPEKIQNAETIYIVGGPWRTLANMHLQDIKYDRDKLAGLSLDRDLLSNLERKVSETDISSLMSTYNLEHKRAEQLPSCARLLMSLLDKTGVERVVVSTAGLRDGILQSYLNGTWSPAPCTSSHPTAPCPTR